MPMIWRVQKQQNIIVNLADVAQLKRHQWRDEISYQMFAGNFFQTPSNKQTSRLEYPARVMHAQCRALGASNDATVRNNGLIGR